MAYVDDGMITTHTLQVVEFLQVLEKCFLMRADLGTQSVFGRLAQGASSWVSEDEDVVGISLFIQVSIEQLVHPN